MSDDTLELCWNAATIKIGTVQELTGIGEEYLLDNYGRAIAHLIDGNVLWAMPQGNTEVTASAA